MTLTWVRKCRWDSQVTAQERGGNLGHRLTQATTDYAFDSAGALSVKYGYDAASNRTSMTDPQTLSTIYTYDVLNRLKTLAFNGQNPAFGFGYDNLSRRNSLTRPNGVNTTYSYDPASSLLSVLHKLGTTTLDGASYTYDNAENRKTRTDKRLNTTLTYGYDNIYQLQSAKQGSTTKESYTYDIVGNRLTSQEGAPPATTYLPNTSNELMSTTNPTVSYTYDNNGSVLTKSDGTQYTWDYENELTQVALPSPGGTVNFKYDPFGRRIQKSFTQSGTTTTTDYLYDGQNRVEDVDVNGNLLARYVHSKGIDEPLEEIALGTTSYYQQDGLGSVTSLSSTSGTISNNTYTYDSYGNTTTSATVVNPFRYTAREFDQETGIYYYRMRYYDWNSGRFVSEDPSAFDLKWPNLYLYVKNRPTGLIDPFGLSPQVLGPFICTWCGEFSAGAAWMWEGYWRMRDRNWQGDDKWYHCMANCQATNVGSGGATAAKIISFFRTDVSSRVLEPSDWRNDDKANKCGQKGGNCYNTCDGFLPPWNPGKPPFPGW